MKTTLALLMSLALISPALAKKKPADFSAFEGTYRGTVALPGTFPVSGVTTIRADVPSSGRAMKLTFQGAYIIPSGTFPFVNVFDYRRSRALLIQDATLGTNTSPFSVAARYKARGKRIIATGTGAIPSSGTPIAIRITTRLTGGEKKPRLRMLYEFTTSGGTTYFTVDAFRRGKN